MAHQRKDILVYDVPPKVRKALVADAKKKNISINDCALSILLADYGLEWSPSGMPFTGDDGSKNFAIRGGAELHQQIDMERANRGGGTLRGVALEHLALHYGLKPEPIGRRSPRRSS